MKLFYYEQTNELYQTELLELDVNTWNPSSEKTMIGIKYNY